ncbi:MAG: hypothetical protein HYW26_02730 [Candidatus Aenigmarchaeota archaeon]|nr:hypothetical protein [Candidatus Aenigmarchaeota archaeon]
MFHYRDPIREIAEEDGYFLTETAEGMNLALKTILGFASIILRELEGGKCYVKIVLEPPRGLSRTAEEIFESPYSAAGYVAKWMCGPIYTDLVQEVEALIL